MSKKLDNPPPMRDDLTYKEWRSDVDIWSDFTSTENSKKGGAVYLTLTGKARQTVRASVSRDELKSDTGLKSVIDALDLLYLKDDISTGFTAFEDFVSYRRPSGTSIQDFCIEFNIKASRCEEYKMKLPDGVLAYYLLKCANLSDEQTHICKATCSNLTMKDMTDQIKRVTSTAGRSDKTDSEPQSVNIQPQFYGQDFDDAEIYYEEAEYEYDAGVCEADEGGAQDTYYARPPMPRSYQYRPSAPRRGGYWTSKPQGAQGGAGNDGGEDQRAVLHLQLVTHQLHL